MRTIITLSITILLSFYSFSQQLKENKIDEFTGNSVQRTSWEYLFQTMKHDMYLRVSKIDSSIMLDVKYRDISNSILSVHEGDKFMIKLSTGEILNGGSVTSEVSCRGCGAINVIGSGGYGLNLSYFFTSSDWEKLKTTSIEKIRFYTSDGYIEQEVKNKKVNLIKDCLALLK